MANTNSMLTLFNKNAGSYLETEFANIEEVLSDIPCLHSITKLTSSLDDLRTELVSYNNTHGTPTILGIGSGDGGAHIILTEAANIFPELPRYIAPFSIGTMINYAFPFNLNNGIIDKANRILRDSLNIDYMEFWETKAEQLAFYIAEQYLNNLPLHSSPLGLIEVNGKKGFNFGIGVASKLIWLYEGATLDQYQNMLENINGLSDIENLPKSYLPKKKKTGALSAVSLVSSALMNTASKNGISSFLTQSTQAEIFIDGYKLPTDEITALISSTYESVSLGINGFAFKPTYRARSECNNKRFQCVAASLSAKEILPYFWDIYSGRQLENEKVHDHMAEEVKIKLPQPTLYQMDGELYLAKDEISIKFDRTVNIIHPYHS